MSRLDKSSINWSMPNAAQRRRLEAQLVRRREGKRGIPVLEETGEKTGIQLAAEEIDLLIKKREEEKAKRNWEAFLEQEGVSST